MSFNEAGSGAHLHRSPVSHRRAKPPGHAHLPASSRAQTADEGGSGYGECMAKEKITYRCSDCGWTSPKWVGQCRECGAWGDRKSVV